MGKINWLGVIASIVACAGIGFLWYGYLFNSQWMAGNGITMDESGTKMFKNGVEVAMSNTPMILNTVITGIYALFMNWLINKTGDASLVKGGTLGLVIGLIHWLGIFIGNMFAQNPISLSNVDGSYSLVMWTIIGALIGGLRKN